MKIRKIFSLCILNVFLFASCLSKENNNDWKEDDLKGKVKSYTSISYRAESRFGNIEKGVREREFWLESDTKTYYNDKGNRTERDFFNSKGEITGKEAYSYDENSNTKQKTSYGRD